MKNKLTKIYNIFKQIENMNGSVGWDQIDVFYYFYEEHKNYLACWQLLYGLFGENKTLKPTIFGITLTELRHFSNAKSVIYTFENSEEPILVATFERNGKHQVSGTVKIEDTLITDEKEVTFVDGMNLDSEVDNSINKQISLAFSFFDYIEKFYALSDNELKSIIGKLKNIDGFTIYIDIDNNVQWSSEENLSEEIADKLVELLHSKTNTEKIIKFNLVEKSPNAYSGIFNPDTMITDFVDISDDDALLLVANYVVVCYHDNNDNIVEINDQEDLQEYRSNYNDNRLFVWKSELIEKGLTENFKNEISFKVLETFQINGETPDGLYSLEDVRLFLDYLYDDCDLLGSFHPDDSFENITNNNNQNLFTKEQQELYNKYLDDMFELDSDGVSVFVQDGYEDVYDYCMNYRNDSYVKNDETSNIESIINKFVTSLETQRNFNAEVFFLIKSELSKSLDKNFVINKIKNIGEDIFSAVRCELVGTKLFCYESFLYDGVNVDINTSSAEFEVLNSGEIKFFNSDGEFMYRAEIETSDDFGFGDYIIKRFTDDWKSTTPAELSQFFDELSKDFQFDKNDENFLGFINIDTEEDKSDDYTVMRYIIHNKKEAEKYANKYGLTIESAQEGELIVNLLNNDSENNDDFINYDFLAYEEDGRLSVGIRTQILPEKYPSSINFIPDGNDWVAYIYFEKGQNSGSELENVFGLVVKSNKNGWVVTGSNGFKETIKLDSENSGIVELSYKEQIDWLNKFIDDWNAIDTNDQFADKKMTKMSADLKAFCYVNGLLLMSADDLLMEILDKNQLLGPINVNGIVYKTKLIRDEDNENKYNLEFYKLEGDAQSELVGDCELIYDERTSSIDEIIWTLPEYELIIDPEYELFESEDLHEMISNLELK